MRIWAGIVLGSLLIGCGTSDTPGTTDADTLVVQAPNVEGASPIVFKEVGDYLKHDTLLIQVTFDIGDGTFVMVASNVDETFEGVRLYRYRLGPDGSAEMLAASSPGYDSWTMLPSFFAYPNPPGTYMILANFGERESWGQKLIFMDWAFTDLGFMDVAYPERIVEEDTTYLKRTNVAPYGRFAMHADTLVFSFACDSVFLYDDMAGHMDQVLAAHAVRYTYTPAEGLALWVRGEKRLVKKPA